MGYRWEVLAWVITDAGLVETTEYEGYGWVDVYYGNSLWSALIHMVKAKRTSGCVQLKWR